MSAPSFNSPRLSVTQVASVRDASQTWYQVGKPVKQPLDTEQAMFASPDTMSRDCVQTWRTMSPITAVLPRSAGMDASLAGELGLPFDAENRRLAASALPAGGGDMCARVGEMCARVGVRTSAKSALAALLLPVGAVGVTGRWRAGAKSIASACAATLFRSSKVGRARLWTSCMARNK